MIVALTSRHFRDLTELTGTSKAVAALAETLDADFTDEGERYRHRDALTGLFADWFSAHTASEVTDALSASSVLWERYRTFAEVVADERVTANPMFTALDQPRIGEYLAPGLPVSINGDYPQAVAAPALGDDTGGVLAEWLGLSEADIDQLDRIRHGDRFDERAADLLDCSTARVPTTTRGSARPAAQRASARSAVSSSRRAWPRHAAPSTRTGCRPTCICSSCAAAGGRSRRLLGDAGVRRADRGGPPSRLPPGRTGC